MYIEKYRSKALQVANALYWACHCACKLCSRGRNRWAGDALGVPVRSTEWRARACAQLGFERLKRIASLRFRRERTATKPSHEKPAVWWTPMQLACQPSG